MTSIKPPQGALGSPTAAHISDLTPEAEAVGGASQAGSSAAVSPGLTAAGGAPHGIGDAHAGTGAGPGAGAHGASGSSAPHGVPAQAAGSSDRARQTGPIAAPGLLHGGPDGPGALAAAVDRGQLSMAQALDQLINQAVGGFAEHLSEVERHELSDVLQLALSSDPTFTALRSEQG